MLRHGGLWSGALLSLGFVFLLLLFGWQEARNFLATGAIATADFLAIVYIGTELTDPRRPPPGKVALVALLLAKLTLVGAFLWLLITQVGAGPVAVVGGLGTAIIGFTFGMSFATRAAVELATPENKEH